MLVPHSATRLAAPVTLTPHRVEYGLWSDPPPDTILMYCTVMYCNVLYCTVLYLGAQRATKSPPKELEVGGHRPPYLLVCNIKAPNLSWSPSSLCQVLFTSLQQRISPASSHHQSSCNSCGDHSCYNWTDGESWLVRFLSTQTGDRGAVQF